MLKKLKTVGVGVLPDGELAIGKKFNVFVGDDGYIRWFLVQYHIHMREF